MMKSCRLSALSIALCWSISVSAQIPQTILYEGFVDERLNGPTPVVLQLFLNAEPQPGENALYKEIDQVVLVNGHFAAVLGDNPVDPADTLKEALIRGEVYLEAVVNGVVYPREPLLAAPYAIVADGVIRGGISSDMLQRGAVGSEHLAPGSVTRDVIAPESIAREHIEPGAVEDLHLAQSYWRVGGNIHNPKDIPYLGTINDRSIDIGVGRQRALRIEHTAASTVNLIGGHAKNEVDAQRIGVVIAGGGSLDRPHRIAADYAAIGGGENNAVKGSYSVIAGGSDHLVLREHSVISGGNLNRIEASFSAIGGGQNGVVAGEHSYIAGGAGNRVFGPFSTVAGGSINEAAGAHSSIAGGERNWIQAETTSDGNPVTHSMIGGGKYNNVQSSFSLIGGGENNEAKIGGHAYIGGGAYNRILDGPYGVIGGGLRNQFMGSGDGAFGVIAGGELNLITESYHAAISGGRSHYIASSGASSIVGGEGNRIESGTRGLIGGGRANLIREDKSSTIIGGESNRIEAGTSGLIGGGLANVIREDSSSAIVGGRINTIESSEACSVGGGAANRLHDAFFSVVGGGYGNQLIGQGDGYFSVVAGGTFNRLIESSGAVICGGLSNRVNTASHSSIGGGSRNDMHSHSSVIAGGANNRSLVGGFQAIGGGYGNIIWAGEKPKVTEAHFASYATIPGGLSNVVMGRCSFAAGREAHALHNGAFVWADNRGGVFASQHTNQFSARATGGARFVTAINDRGDPLAGVKIGPGGGAWANLSDRDAKERFEPVDVGDVLKKVAALPITTWSMKAEEASIRHIGPMAQDFHAAFGVGDSERHIVSTDADGVALAAIQGLNQRNEQLRAELELMRAANEQMATELKAIKQHLGL